MSVLDGRPGEGTWSVFAMKVAEERDAAREALANSDACWRMEQEFLQRKLDEARAEAIAWKELADERNDECNSIQRHMNVTARERDEARAELVKTSADFHDVWESRDKVIEERERARQACNTYWHDLTRIALLCAQTDDEYPLKAVERTVRERDEALAQVARREREHEALLETAQKALAHVEAERDALQEALDDTRDDSAYKFRGTYLEDASGGRWWSQSHMSYARAEIEMLRGVGCREAKEGEPESGPCGVCLKCAEKRGAKWALERHGNPFASKTLEQYAEEICCDARRER